MAVTDAQIRDTIADEGLKLRSHQVRPEGHVYVVEGGPRELTASIPLRTEELGQPFTVLGRIRHIARSLADD